MPLFFLKSYLKFTSLVCYCKGAVIKQVVQLSQLQSRQANANCSSGHTEAPGSVLFHFCKKRKTSDLEHFAQDLPQNLRRWRYGISSRMLALCFKTNKGVCVKDTTSALQHNLLFSKLQTFSRVLLTLEVWHLPPICSHNLKKKADNYWHGW